MQVRKIRRAYAMRRISGVLAILAMVTGLARAQTYGGSNYMSYAMDANCNGDLYVVLQHYDAVHEPAAFNTINAQLQSIRNSGQIRMRMPIFHAERYAGHNWWQYLDSTGGNLTPQVQENLRAFLARLKSLGFIEILVSFFPQGDNYPGSAAWKDAYGNPTWNEELFQNNWNTIANVRNIVASAGISYRIDLMNEGNPWNSLFLQYEQRLWNYYAETFGKNDTVGFSIDPSHPDSIASIYGPSPFGYHGTPYVLDVHFYPNGNYNLDYNYTFGLVRNSLTSQGMGSIGWIIGEASYNNQAQACGLRTLVDTSGQVVFWLAQWPLHYPQLPSCPAGVAADTVVPVDYSNWDTYFVNRVPCP